MCILVFYCGFLLLVLSMSIFRLVCLTAHLDWIQEHNDKFPSACGDWAEDYGCTRILLEKDQCVSFKGSPSIVSETEIIFKIKKGGGI